MRDPTTRLRSFARWIRALLALRGAAIFLAFVVGLCVASLLLDLWLRLDLGARVWLAHGMVATWLYVLWTRLVHPQLGRWSPLDVAQATDHALSNPGWITRRYASALQYATSVGANPAGSEQLVDVARKQAVTELEEFQLRDRINWQNAARSTTIVMALVLAPTIATVLRPAEAGLWFERWFLGSDARWPQDTWLEIDGIRDGQLVVPRGEPYEIRVRARDDTVVPDSVEATYEIDGGARTKTTLSKYADNDFRLTLPPVSKTGEIRFQGNDDKQGPFMIVPRDRPRISEFRVSARLPGREPVRMSFQSQERDIGFKAKTEVVLEVAAAEDVVRMDVIADDVSSLGPARVDARTWSLSWTHEATRSFALEVVSAETGLRSHPYALDFALEDDRPPQVNLRIMGVRSRVTPVARIPTRVLAEDDGGLVRADLAVTVRPAPNATGSARSQTDVLHGPDDRGEERQVEIDHEVRIADLGAVPGETVEIAGTATDRCHLGPQIGRSRTRVLRVVRPEVLYREIALRLQRTRAAFRKGINTAKETADLLSSEPDPGAWTSILRRHRLVERTTWSTRRTLQESLQELLLNGLVEEQAERIVRTTVLEPLDNLYDRMLQDQRSGLEQRLDANTEPRTGDLHGRQKGIVAQMDRILKAMQQWDSFVDLVNQLDEVIELQTGVRKETQDSKTNKKKDGEERKDK